MQKQNISKIFYSIKFYIPLLSALVWITIGAMSIWNPSDTVSVSVQPNYLFLLGAAPIIIFFIIWFVLNQKDTCKYLLLFLTSLIIFISAGILMGIHFHRDFAGFPIQMILIYGIIFLYKVDILPLVKNQNKAIYRGFATSAIMIFFGYSVWVILMGYAIATRQEPRWIESIFYNLINCLILIILALIYSNLLRKMDSVLEITDKKILLNNRNLSNLISNKEQKLFRLFLSKPGFTVNCSSIRNWKSQEKHNSDCLDCIENRWTVSECSYYRNCKNQIGHLKKYLEILQIGTIIPASENMREIKEMGWKLKLFHNVVLEKKTS